MAKPLTNTTSLFSLPFSFTLKAILPSIVTIFVSGYGLGMYITTQSNKLELIQIQTKHQEELQTEIQKYKDLKLEYYAKKVEDLQGVVNQIKKGGEGGTK